MLQAFLGHNFSNISSKDLSLLLLEIKFMKPNSPKIGLQAAQAAQQMAQQVSQQVVEVSEKVSPYKLQGKLRIAFWVMISCIGFSLAYAAFSIAILFKEETIIQEQYQAIEYHADQTASAMSYSMSQISIFIAIGQEIYLNRALDHAETQAKEHVMALQIATLATNTNTDPKVTSIETDYNKFRYEINNLDDVTIEQRKSFLINVLLPICHRVSSNCDELADAYQAKSRLQLLSLSEQIKSLYWQFGIFFLIVTGVALYWSRNALSSLVENIELVRNYISTLKKGNLPTQTIHTRNEFNDIILDIEQLSEQLRGIKNFANEVKNGNFEDEVSTFFNNGEIGEALTQMRVSLRNVAEQEKKRNWIAQGTALIADTSRLHNDNTNLLCEAILEQIVTYVGCQQGGIFILSENDTLVMTACYAYGRKKMITKELEKGEGLIGEVARDGELLYITDLPPLYLELASGLGEAVPSSLALVPIKNQNTLLGVMELASIELMDERKLILLERVGEILASVLGNVLNAQKTSRLLQETRESAERMNAQEEELRQNTEELLATREELEKQLEGTKAQLEVQAHFVEDNSCAVIITNENGIIEMLNSNSIVVFGFSKNEVKGLPVSRLIPSLQNLAKHAREDKLSVSFSTIQAFRKDRQAIELWLSVSKIELNQEIKYSLTMALR
ncbi:MAG: GAF domain-containing protein [Cytophagales bacterium]|nr:MAG: GAF domain-containing protein [Cytophagales bacterium]TAF59642.1 MAG: GAF domain-containing protein [Cytophagales bacterium]